MSSAQAATPTAARRRRSGHICIQARRAISADQFPNPGRPRMVPTQPEVTPHLIAEHGLKPDEYERILKLIGREPSVTELGIFSAMWNEHCSYKSSKVHL